VDEDDVGERVGSSGMPLGDELVERRVFSEHGVNRLDEGVGALAALGLEPIVSGWIELIASSRHSASEIRVTRLPACSSDGSIATLLAQLELVLGVVAEQAYGMSW
jgi:hypothetical protein